MSIIIGGLLGAVKIAAGIMGARAVGKGISAIGERITPYNKSRSYKQIEQQSNSAKEIELMREASNEKMQQEKIIADRENIILNQMLNRQNGMIHAEENAYHSLRHSLIQDAIRNFPLNISPLVLLENNGIDVQFLLHGPEANGEEPEITKRRREFHEALSGGKKYQDSKSFIETLSHPKPLNVFITPMHIDTRVGGKDIIAAQVYDSVYSSLESIFVNEYSRNGERPITFYATAWNRNAKGGLHAAEELYYFLKEMPTIVIEPRFDGKTVKLMFSCWKIGYDSSIHSRQELEMPLDINSMLAIAAYERSKKALESFNNVECSNKVLNDQKTIYEHNISIFEQLNLERRIRMRFDEICKFGHSTVLDELGDYSKLLYTNQNDIFGIADTISAIAGMMICALADTHHLLANDVAPQFPRIYQKYFGDYLKDPELRKTFSKMYERTYNKLSREFPNEEPRRIMEKENVKKLLGTTTVGESLASQDVLFSLREKCVQLGADKNLCHKWSIERLIDFYIENIDDDAKFRQSIIPIIPENKMKELSIKLMNK